MHTLLIVVFVMMNIHIITVSAQTTCESPKPDDIGQLSKLSALSKYFHYDSRVENPFSYTYDQAQEICRKNNLELAEVTTSTDMTSLSNFVSDVRDHYWIGMNDKQNEGDFVESDGYTKIQFQAFTGSNPDNGDGDEDCVQVIYEDGRAHMDDVACESTAGVLCQFSRGSYCLINSYQKNIGVDDQELVQLGASTHYFVSTVQKTRSHAFAACLTAGKYLLAFNDRKLNEELMDEMKFYRESTYMDPETTFWTSGTISKANMGEYTGTIFWDVLNIEYNYTENPEGIDYIWGDGEPHTHDDSDKDCLDVSYEKLESMSGPPYPVWRASNCRLPRYFICMDLNITVPNDQQRSITNDDNEDIANLEMDESKNEDQGCNKVFTTVDPPTINLLKPLSVDQTLNLMLFTLKNDLQSGKTKVNLKSSISWKRNTIELIFNIFKESVSTDYVPHGFLNVVQEINLIYQNYASGADEPVNPSGWTDTINPILKKCFDSVQELTFSTVGLKIKYYNSSTDSNNLLRVPQEHADLFTNLDMALDVLWYLFSFSLGICYHSAGKSSSIWASQYYILFTLDFMEKLEDKWVLKDDANILKQSLIFGNVDVFTTMDNLRSATTAAYLRNKIVDRQVVRPISIEKLEGKKMSIDYQKVNFKTGVVFN